MLYADFGNEICIWWISFFFFFFAQLDILDYVLEAVLQWMSSDLDNMCASPDSAGMWTTSI